MQATVTPAAENAIADIANRHGLSREAVLAMLLAVNAGGGTMAQFAIPELGGSGQWMQGGMTMVGDMFNYTLKARVDSLCGELSQLLASTTVFPAAAPGAFASANWWPADLGVPSSTGGQNDARYAIFPGARRLAVQAGGATRIFDTGDHQIGGVQQQQGGSTGTVSFTSQFGTFDVSSLRELGAQHAAEASAPAPAPQHLADPAPHFAPHFAPQSPPQPQPQPPEPAPPAPGDHGAIIAAIESLAGLHQRGVLTDEEFAAKKTELLGRL
ncbi:MAG: SHOCT domain-containing protein [Segniliparus sp.]|uniref:SHOCT domain-containing protein n=1 Tax=Segniliparus sp. TaxID=2804064 RepID=UPI003F3843D9